MSKGIFFTLFILISIGDFSLYANGQSGYIFHHLNTRDGLSNSNVLTILKDSYGFLWIGTESGINRYDGYSFKVFRLYDEDNNNVELTDIYGLEEDGLGNIWVRCSYKYMLYSREKDYFISDIPKFLKGLGIEVDRTYKIHIDKNKGLWVLSERDVHYYDFKKQEHKTYSVNFHIDDKVLPELSDDGENLYAMLDTGYVWRVNSKTGEQEEIKIKGGDKLFRNIFVDNGGGLWVYSQQIGYVLYKKNPDVEWSMVHLVSKVRTSGNGVLNIIDDKNGNIWIGTDHAGVFIYNKASGEYINQVSVHREESSIASNNIRCLYGDNNGVVWMGHSKKGISIYHDSFHKFRNITYPDCNDVSCIYEGKQNNVWLGTDGNGVFKISDNKEMKCEKLPTKNDVIVDLLESRQGCLWIATYLNGLYCYKDGHVKHYTAENSKLRSNNVWCLKEDRYGVLWIGSLNEGVQYLPAGETSLDSLVSVSEDLYTALAMHYDGGDNIYVATVNGLGIIDITNRNYSVRTGNRKGTQLFKDRIVGNVYLDSQNKLWLAHRKGVSIWDMKKDTLYFLDKETGLCDNIVRGFIEDNNKDLWVSTSNGLSVITTDQGSLGDPNFVIRNYSTKDGLITNFFNNKALCKRSNGDILMGTNAGFTIINPNKLLYGGEPNARVFFTGLSVGNEEIQVDSVYNGRKTLDKAIELTDKVAFSYKDKLIAFQFSTGALLNADKYKYAYRLEGFNDEWVETTDNKIVFSSLKPGDYKLVIKACNSEGVWSKYSTSLDINVNPPFYLSVMGKGLFVLILLLLIIIIFYRNKKRNNLKLEHERKFLKQEQEKTLNEMKLRFFTNVSHDLRTPLTLITTPLQSILDQKLDENLRKKLNSVYKNAEHLFTLINSLLDFRKLDFGGEVLHLQLGDFVNFVKDICISFSAHANDRNMKFSFEFEIERLFMQFDPVKVHKIIANLLSNAFKYTPNGGSVSVRVSIEGSNVDVQVSDTGPGINSEEKKHVFQRFYQASQKQDKTGSGIGLHIVSEYVQMHHGDISISDNLPHGCVFTVTLPIQEWSGNEDFLEDDENLENEAKEISSKPSLLFVEDNTDLCEFMADSLSDDYTVVIANNGKEALEKLDKFDINIVVSDVMMPIMNGTDLCNQIKTNIQWSHIPVILLTARTAEEFKLEGFELGADDYITKPFNFNILKLRIEKWLEWTEKCHVSFSQKVDISPSDITITSLDEQLIEKAVKIVEEHINDTEFTVEVLGDKVGLSRSHLYKKLMSITGKGPAEFIRIIRLKRGKQLLEQSQMQIAEIAYEVGFNSPKRFAINFKNEFGITPSEYQKSQKEKD